MLIIGLFTKYFLLLMVIQGYIVGILDANTFYRNNMRKTGLIARFLGIGFIFLGITLFILRNVI